MAITRRSIEPFCFVELHGDLPAVVITYHDGERHRVWRCYFDDAEELACDLINAVLNDGLPRCAADAALACVRDSIGSYRDELFGHLETGCRMTEPQLARKPPAAFKFKCWERFAWFDTAFLWFLFIGGVAHLWWLVWCIQ